MRGTVAIFTDYSNSEWGRAGVQLAEWLLYLGFRPAIYALRPPESLPGSRWDRHVHLLEPGRDIYGDGLIRQRLHKTDLFVHLYPDSTFGHLLSYRWSLPDYRHVFWLPGNNNEFWREVLTDRDPGTAFVSGDYQRTHWAREQGARVLHVAWQALPRTPSRPARDGLQRLGIFVSREQNKTVRTFLPAADRWLGKHPDGVLSLWRGSATLRRQTLDQYLALAKKYGPSRVELVGGLPWAEIPPWMLRQDVIAFVGAPQRLGVDISLAAQLGSVVLAPPSGIHDLYVSPDQTGYFLPTEEEPDEDYQQLAYISVEEGMRLSRYRWNEPATVDQRFEKYWLEVGKTLNRSSGDDEMLAS